ncbi:protocadherin Fat 4-like [Osmerus mordax]|uniref:protocadherin Fat 4-like n=1 Tax=Osmerus mordax TaxID=8014 RepID=UPI00350F8354
MTATDSDDGFNGHVRYSIRGGEGKFSIDPESGLVSLTGALDRETQAEYSLKVEAQDQGRPIRSATASLLIQVSDVNDNSPRFTKSEYQVEVLETTSKGTALINLTAVDEDEGLNGRISYSIVTQDPPSAPAVFELDSSTGVLQLAQGLDYESVMGYSLTVKAEDGGTPPLEGLSTVLVRVKDVNDNPPRFSQESYDFAVSENFPGGSSIVTLEVTDVDEGGFSNGHFVFTSDIFDINKQGVVSLNTDATLDRETKANYLLQITAVDQPVDGLNSTAQLNITVLDYNDNTPQFIDLPDPIFVPEGEYSASTPGEVLRILATDSDIGANAEVTISISSPSTLFQFREDGTLLVVGPLDRETRDVYELVIVASDNGTPQRQNITTIRLSVTDMNDNTPVFSASIYSKRILVKDAEVGDVVLTLLATDKDIGNNSLITYSFSAGNFTHLSLNDKTGVVTIASDLADVTEDTALDFTVMAQDHGLPPLNSTARGLVSLKTVSLSEGVAFESPSYNFSVAENQPEGAAVGMVKASPGSSLYDISYVLMTHTDLFTIDPQGALFTKETLDKESQDWYILEVKAVDTRSSPTSAVALVRVEVEDVNEAPKFIDGTYQAKIFSIAPYKYPVVQVKATDPDSGDSERLQYSMSEPSSYFDVDPSTGQVYVVSAVGLAGQTTTLTMKATDPLGLQATAMVQVDVQGSASSDVVVISLNQAANIVDKKIPEMEESLGRALGWTVRVIRVSSSNGGEAESRTFRNNVKTFVSIIATDNDKVIPAEEIKKKLQSESATVKAELEKVFGAGLEYDVQDDPVEASDNQAIVIALGVLLGLSMLGLLLMGTYTIVKFIRTKKNAEDSDRESFAIDNQSYINQDRKTSGNLNLDWRSDGIEKKAEPEPDSQKKDSNSDDSQTSAL